MNIGDIDLSFFDDPSDDDLLLEFEKMLEDEPKKSDGCSHVWERVGTSPITGEPWVNCKYCDIAREEYERSKKPI